MIETSKIQLLTEEAYRLFSHGDMQGAADLFETLVEFDPNLSSAWIGLGRLALTVPDLPAAIDFFAQAVAVQPDSTEALSRLGDVQRRSGLLAEAHESLLLALSLQPGDLVVACQLANNYVDQGELLAAKDLLTTTLEQYPEVPELYLLRGMTFLHLGNAEDAETDLRLCLGLAPENWAALVALGGILLDRQQIDAAVACVERAANLAPEASDVLRGQAAVCMAKRDWQVAISFFDKILKDAPDDISIALQRAVALVEAGEAVTAIDALEYVLSLGASEQWVHEMIGVLFAHQGQWQVAIENLEKAVEREPLNANAWNVLIVAYNRQGLMEKAGAAAQKVLEINPNHVSALVNLAGCYIDLGRHDEGVETFKQGLLVDPTNPSVHSGLMFGMLFSSETKAENLLTIGQRFDVDVCQALLKSYPFSREKQNPDRKLRIGWVSSDLRGHPVGAFIGPFFPYMDPTKVELYVYSNWAKDDTVTAAIKPYTKVWRHIRGLGDNAVAECIRTDEIDILVDLNGHTAGHRLGIFARKPAPIQVEWLGFPGTSGMSAMDYVLIPNDDYLMRGEWCVEKPWRLPSCYGVRSGLPNISVREDLPVDANGYFTFACMNRYSKVSAAALDLWANLLSLVKNSKLLLIGRGGADEQTLNELLARFSAKGIAHNRLEILENRPFTEYFETFNRADICLDPFPFNGGTTGFDSIWMGVPFITLRGDALHSRAGSNILKYVGLDDLIAETETEYLQKACDLTANLPALRRYRANLRQRMEASPLMDCMSFSKGLEEAFRQMWKDWCLKAD